MEINSESASRIFLQEIDEISNSNMGSVGEGPASITAVQSEKESA